MSKIYRDCETLQNPYAWFINESPVYIGTKSRRKIQTPKSRAKIDNGKHLYS